MTSVSSAPTVADAIEHTLEWLDRQGCMEPTEDRRGTRRSRYRATARVSYRLLGTDRSIHADVQTRNLSRTGVSFLHKSLLYPRQTVNILLPLPDKSITQLRGQVVRVRTAGPSQYEIGVEFTELSVAVC